MTSKKIPPRERGRAQLALRAVLCAGTLPGMSLPLCGGVAVAQIAQPSDTARILQPVIKRARYWFEHGRMDEARVALSQARQLAPSDPDVLALEGQMSLQDGDIADAHRILKQIRDHSNDPDAGRQLDMDLQARAAPAPEVQNARALAQRGATAQAAAAYLRAFPDRPPSLYALEYYRTLAGVPEQRTKAQQGLGKLVSSSPDNMEYQIAYAQSLVWDEKTRITGIRRLEALGKMAGLTGAQKEQIAATTRQSVLWLPVNATSDSLISSYLNAHPDDRDIQALRGRALGGTLKPFEIERQKGWDALRSNNLQAAVVAFRQGLALAPNDPDTLGGLGVTLLRQKRDAEARTYLERAIQADPASAARWRAAESGAVLNDTYARANYLFAKERYAETLALINPLIAHAPGQSWLKAMRADILERTGRRDEAITIYRSLLSAEPRNVSYRERLVRALIDDRRFDEANAVLSDSSAPNAQLKALIYDSQAAQASTQAERLSILQRADRDDALSPWSRLHYAQALIAENRRSDADQVMAPLLNASSERDQASLQAALYYAAQTGDDAAVTRLRALVPERAMTPELQAVLRRAAFRQDLANAPSDREAARFYFAHILDQGDPDGSLAQAAAMGLYDRGDAAGAAQLLDIQIAHAGGRLNPAQRVAFAGAFLHMRDLERARRFSASLKGVTLTPEQVTQLAQIDTALAVATSDRLNEHGNRARAYEALAPALDKPNPPVAANLALARLYASGGQYAQAYQINLRAVQHDPGDLDAYLALIQTTIAMHRYAEASGYLQQMNAIAPTDPRSWYAAAQLDRARGNIRAAVRELAQARLLRIEQIAPERGQAFTRPNPFASEDVTLVSNETDPLIRQMDADLTQISDGMAASVNISPGIDSRSGSGLNGLSNVTTDVAGTLPVGGGHIRLAATPTFLSSRSYRSGDVNGPRDIGYNPLNSVIGGAVNQSSAFNATGVALSARYDWRWLTLDAGTSPLGFAVTNVLGGVSIAPKLARNTILTVGVERRSVQDSLVSYSGLRDASGATWGGVTRNRLYAQLAYGDADASVYMRGGGSYLTGRNTKSNTGYEAGAGGQIKVWDWGQQNLHVGMDLTWFGYDRNEYQFTYGNGGYFSPQNFLAFTFPVTYAGSYKQIDWRVIGRAGYQTYHSNRAETFPNNPDSQALLANVAPLYAYQEGNSANGLTGGIFGAVDYRMTPSLKLSLNADYQRAGPWNEVRAFVAAKYSFLGTK